MTDSADAAEPAPAPRRFARPPGRTFYALAAVPAGFLLWLASSPTANFWASAGALALLGLAAGIWVLRLVLGVVVAGRPGRAWALTPLAGLVLCGLLAVHAPLHARWTLAAGGFTRIAEPLSAPDRPTLRAEDLPTGRRIGTYRIERVDVEGRVVLFTFTGDAFARGDGGMAYVPDGVDVPADQPYVASLRHLRGNWYYWFQELSD